MFKIELAHTTLILVTLASVGLAIRVDFNTNKGPIVPPTSTPAPIPKRPYREPAPVYEDQSDDFPNPNPYRYILPPPSRPRYPQQQDFGYQEPNYYSEVISPAAINNLDYNNFVVPSLAAQYIPNVGTKYSAVIPKDNYYSEYKQTKINGKYNPKLKKYKAFEKKIKYVPHSYYPVQFEFPFLQQQLLPFQAAPQPFRAAPVPQSTSTTTEQSNSSPSSQQQKNNNSTSKSDSSPQQLSSVPASTGSPKTTR